MPRPIRWLAVALWCGLIYWFSAAPPFTGAGTRGLLARWLPWLSPPALEVLNFLLRKAAHLTAFGILALLSRWAFAPHPRSGWGAWAFATLYAVTDEWHQTYVPGRSGQAGDVVLDSLGAAIALGVWAGWQRRRGSNGAPS
ncbi:MAG: VanZ family protein [Firmicutes bacterium]|nr:VanZ family protein [Bacillota bacterium]